MIIATRRQHPQESNVLPTMSINAFIIFCIATGHQLKPSIACLYTSDGNFLWFHFIYSCWQRQRRQEMWHFISSCTLCKKCSICAKRKAGLGSKKHQKIRCYFVLSFPFGGRQRPFGIYCRLFTDAIYSGDIPSKYNIFMSRTPYNKW